LDRLIERSLNIKGLIRIGPNDGLQDGAGIGKLNIGTPDRSTCTGKLSLGSSEFELSLLTHLNFKTNPASQVFDK